MVVLLPVVLAVACTDNRTNRRTGKIEVLDEQGNARASVDFGRAQVGLTATVSVRVRNGGAGALTIESATFSQAVFGTSSSLPSGISGGQESTLELTFTPTVADQRVTGTVVIGSDDPDSPQVELQLAGTGVTATAVAQPTSLDFGEVYVGESKSLTFTLTNSGSNSLPVSAAQLTMVGADVTADLSPLQKTLGGGESAQVQVKFAPTTMSMLLGELTITLPNGVGDQRIPLRGSGIEAKPKLCFRYDDGGSEACTDGTSSLDVRFGSYCDERVYPRGVDGGLRCELDGGVIPSSRSGVFYVRNEGNTPVSFTLGITAGQTNRCDGGASIDFSYSNAPVSADGGSPSTFSITTQKLPMVLTQARPWETAPVSVTYRARSICRGGDDTDLSTILWTRQAEPAGTARRPMTMLATLTGNSLLANPLPNAISFTGNSPLPQEVTLVSNSGDGPVRLLTATLYQSSDGGSVPDVPCSSATSGPCTHFAWISGPTLPVELEGTSQAGTRVSKVVGKLAYGKLEDGGMYVVPPTEQRAMVVVTTSDPYTPTVIVPLFGRPN